MVHGDDQGMVLPPRVAAYQAVIIPAGLSKSTPEEAAQGVKHACMDFYMKLSQAGVRVKLDDGEEYTFGFKCNDWEMKGVPMRIEVGPKDLDKGTFVMAKRNKLGKDGKVIGNV